MTDETRQSLAETVSHEHLHSVVHRRGPLTKDDYREAISDLARAMVQDEVRHICCSVCEDTGHTAETCHHNPLLLARQWSQATGVWCCYHCGFVATNDEEARDHFGFNEQVRAKCQRGEAGRLKVELATRNLRITGLEETLRPFAEIALARDDDASAADMISGPDLAITPAQVRAARRILDIAEQLTKSQRPSDK